MARLSRWGSLSENWTDEILLYRGAKQSSLTTARPSQLTQLLIGNYVDARLTTTTYDDYLTVAFIHKTQVAFIYNDINHELCDLRVVFLYNLLVIRTSTYSVRSRSDDCLLLLVNHSFSTSSVDLHNSYNTDLTFIGLHHTLVLF